MIGAGWFRSRLHHALFFSVCDTYTELDRCGLRCWLNTNHRLLFSPNLCPSTCSFSHPLSRGEFLKKNPGAWASLFSVSSSHPACVASKKLSEHDKRIHKHRYSPSGEKSEPTPRLLLLWRETPRVDKTILCEGVLGVRVTRGSRGTCTRWIEFCILRGSGMRDKPCFIDLFIRENNWFINVFVRLSLIYWCVCRRTTSLLLY